MDKNFFPVIQLVKGLILGEGEYERGCKQRTKRNIRFSPSIVVSLELVNLSPCLLLSQAKGDGQGANLGGGGICKQRTKRSICFSPSIVVSLELVNLSPCLLLSQAKGDGQGANLGGGGICKQRTKRSIRFSPSIVVSLELVNLSPCLLLSQAKEITATVGQAFELAYKKFLETKQAQEDFKRLKTMLQTATPEQKVEIEKKLIEVNKIRAAEAERQKKMAVIQSKMPEPYVKPVTKITVKGTKGQYNINYCRVKINEINRSGTVYWLWQRLIGHV